MSEIECVFVLKYDDANKARKIKESLEPDNEDYITLNQEKNKLKATCKADGPLELLHTVDDFLACLSISEDSLNQFGKVF